MTKRVNVGVVGCGEIAETIHIPNLLNIPEARLVALCDVDQNRLARTGAKFHVENAFSDLTKFLGTPSLEAVIICTPTPTHSEIAIRAAEAGKHVFVEKPIASSSSEAEAVIRAAKSNQVKLCVGHQMRFLPNHVKAKELLESGTIGDLLSVEIHSETLLIKPEDGILLDYGVHFIDLLCWYLDSRQARRVGALIEYQGNVEVAASLLLQFNDGVIGQIGVFWVPQHRSWEAVERYARILGTKGRIFTDQSSPVLSVYRAGSLLSRVRGSQKIMLPFAIHPLVPISQTTYRKELEDFISSVAEDREPTVTGAQALNVLSIMEAAKRSFEKQTFVEVN